MVKQGLTITLIALQVWQPVLAGVVATHPQITQGQAANGVPVVNIATPGRTGISHNTYSRFDVDRQGLILNNSGQPVNTQLGGYIPGNANLPGGSARLILNEVSGSLPSQLKGYMEIAGQKAEMIIANPAGITCNGCGFINTSRSTLTTGKPLFGSDGNLSGFRVEDGLLNIEGLGLNASNTDRLNLYSRALVLNAQLHARDLHVVTGANDINTVTDESTSLEPVTAAPNFSIDSSSLGGMYANRIRLVGTEAGVGMRLAAPVAAMNGNLEITSNGDVRLVRASATQRVDVRAEGNVAIDSDGAGERDGISSGAGTALTATDDVILASGANITGAGINIQADGVDAAQDSEIAARGALSIHADNLQLAGTIASRQAITLTGSTVTNQGDIAANTGLGITASSLDNSGRISSASGNGHVTLTGDLINDGGEISLGEALDITAAYISSVGGTLAANGMLTITAADAALDNTEGLLQGNEGVTVTTAGLINLSGEVVSNKDIRLLLAAGDMDNRDGLIETHGNIELQATGQLQNAGGLFHSGSYLTFTIDAFDQSAVGGTFTANTRWHINAAGNIVFNSADIALPGALDLVSQDGLIAIDRRIEAGTGIDLDARTIRIGQNGFVATQGAFTASADGMDNEGLIYGKSAVDLVLGQTFNNGAERYLTDAASYRNAVVLSEGNINLSALNEARMLAIRNYGGHIESLAGDITLRAGELKNYNIGWAHRAPYQTTTTQYSTSRAAWDAYNRGYAGEDVRVYRYLFTITHHDVLSRGHRGQIVAGRDITIEADSVENNRSTISAARNLRLDADTVTNTASHLRNRISEQTDYRYWDCYYDKWGDKECGRRRSGSMGTETYWGTEDASKTIEAVIEAGNELILNADTVVNGDDLIEGSTSDIEGGQVPDVPGTPPQQELPEGAINIGIVDPTSLPGFRLPGNGLFRLTPPGHPYLIETDPALNTYEGFLGSGYLLDHLEWSPEITQRRLGDSYYELMLIRDALMASMGSRFVHPLIADERQQYEYLMDNAIAASESLHLTPGISLSRAQIDALQQDIVWLEERVISGERVLVPVVYLAQGSSRVLHDGAVIGGGSVSLSGTAVRNTGLIRAREQLSIVAADDISNLGGTLDAGGNLLLDSGGDILNESGRMAGNNVVLQAAGDITHRTWSQRESFGSANNGTWSTLVGDTATVEARGSQVQIAGGNIQVTGGQLTGTNVALGAGGSILLDTVQVEQGYTFSGSDWEKSEQQVRHLQTQISALQTLQLNAGADLIAIAADIRAGDSATLDAGGSLLLLAAEESDHYESHSKSDGSFGRSKSHDLVHHESRLVGTTISVGRGDDPEALSGDLTLAAGKDITLYASQTVATGQIDVTAGGNLNLIAGIETVSHSEQSSKESAATYRNNNQGYVQQTAAASALSAGGDLTLNAGKDVRLTASILHSDQTLRIGEEIVDPSSLTDASPQRPLNVIVDTLALTNESWNETEKGFKGPLKELVKGLSLILTPTLDILSAGLIDLPETEIASFSRSRTVDVLQAGSLLQAGDISINARDTVALINADVSATGVASVSANDIIIGAIAETHSNTHEEGHETVSGLGMRLGRDEVRVAGVEMVKRSVADANTLVEWNGSTINADQLVLNAKRDLEVLGSMINVSDDATLSAGNQLTLGGHEAIQTRESKETTEVTTVSASIRNAYLDAALAVKAMSEAVEGIKEAKRALAEAEKRADRGELDPDDVKYFQMNLAAATANLVQMEIAMAAALAMGAATAGTGFYASGSAQREKVVTTSTTTQGVWKGSNVTVGGNATLVAGDKIKVQGSDVSVKDTLKVNADKIVLLAGEEHSSSESNTVRDSQGISMSATGGGVNVGIHEMNADSIGTHYVNSHLHAGKFSSTSKSLQLAGAVIEADQVDVKTGKLSVVSLQDTFEAKSKSVGGNIGISGSTGGVTGGSIAADFQKSETERRWVNEMSGIIGHDSIKITADDTLLTGAIIANARRDASGGLVDQGQLQLKTKTLAIANLYDVDKTKAIGANLAVGIKVDGGGKSHGAESNAPIGNTSTGAAAEARKGNVPVDSITVGGLYNGHVTERTTFATLGKGLIEVGGEILTEDNAATLVRSPNGVLLNRDVANTQLITKDQDIGGLNASVTMDGRWFSADGRAEMAQQQRTVGTNMQAVVRGMGSEIDTGVNLGARMAGVENPTAATEKIVDMVGFAGLIPTELNNGGFLAQVAGQFLPGSDANQRQMVGASSDSAYVLANPEMGWVPISETPGYHLLSPAQQERLKDVVVSSNPVAIAAGTATYQNSTNGMLNTPALALYNAVTQTHDMINDPAQQVLVTLNYNPTRGFFADGFESLQDKLAIDLGQKWMATDVAVDTGKFANNVMLARGMDQANFANHSQGNLLNFSGLLAVGLDTVIKFGAVGNENFSWNMFGSPVNADKFNGYLKGNGMLLSSSSVNEGDFVGQRLGGNYGLFVVRQDGNIFSTVHNLPKNSTVFEIRNINATSLDMTQKPAEGQSSSGSIFALFGKGQPSPHSNYSCVVKCGADPKKVTMPIVNGVK